MVETENGLLAICKIFPRRSQGFFTELAVARNLIHESLLEAQEVRVETAIDYWDGSSEACSCIIYRNVEGAEELELKVRREGSISETMTRQILNQLIGVISYLHSNGLAHMDIQPANILVSPGGKIKLCDFDLAHHTEKAVPEGSTRGSPGYMAPEMVVGHRYQPQACDVFSLGVSAFVLARRHLPWKEGCACKEDPFFRLLLGSDES